MNIQTININKLQVSPLMKIIEDTIKYDEYSNNKDEFYKYIEKIGHIKTHYFKNIEPKQEVIQQEVIQQESNTDDDLDKTYEQTYKQKQQECQEKNNNSTLITVQVRNPELQNRYRKAIIKRFDKCIISDYDNEVCEAAHIKPFSESNNLESEDFDIDNGLLLNCILHKLFDKHYWSINPITLCFEIFISPQNNVYNLIKQYDAKYIEILKKYPKIVNYLVIHYNTTKRLSKNNNFNIII
jgi:hypothetical protein